MKKILHMLLIGVLLVSSVGRVTAFDWEKYFPSSVGNSIERLENKFGEGVTKKVVVGATAVAVAIAGYLLYVNKSFSRFWNWARGEGETDLEKKEEIVTEEYEFEKNNLEERFAMLNEQFITLKPENENYAEELNRLSREAQSLLKDTDQFKFEDLYNKIFNLNSDVITAKKLILEQKRNLLSIEKDINQKLQSIEKDLFALGNKDLDKEEVSNFQQRLQEVLDVIIKYNLDAYIQQVEKLEALVKKPEELTESAVLKDQLAPSTEESFQELEKSKIEVIISSFPKNIEIVNFSMQEKKTTGKGKRKKTVLVEKNYSDIGYATFIYQGNSDAVQNVIVLDECEGEPITCWNDQIPFNSEAEKQIRNIQINIFDKMKKVPQLNIYYVIVNRNLKKKDDLANKIVKKLKTKVNHINIVSHVIKEDVDFLSNLASKLVDELKKNNIMD